MNAGRVNRIVQVLMAILLAASVVPAQAQLRGKLFMTQEQRDYLDYLRNDFLVRNSGQGFDIEDYVVPDIPNGDTGPAAPVELTLQGIIRKADGSYRVWLNQQLLAEAELPYKARVQREGNSLVLVIPTSAGNRVLRTGQTIELNSGAIQERYQRPQPAAVATASTEGSTLTGTGSDNTAESEDDSPSDSEPADTAAATVATADQSEATSEDTATAATDNPDALLDALPDAIKQNPESLQSMIDQLMTLQEELDADSEAE